MSMSKNLHDYVKVYKDFMPVELCQKILPQLENAEWTEHTFYNASTDELISHENELAISHDNVDGKQELMQRIWEVLHQYVMVDMESMHDWFDSWNGFSDVRFNRYDPSTKMKLHCDHIHSMFDGQRKGVPVLTVLGALNDGYTGGEFIMFGDEVIEMPARSVIVFPSNFLYPHEVRPVKSGIRYSFVSWAW